MACLLCPKKRPKIPGGVLPEKLGGGVRYASGNPYPISDQSLWFSLSYFRPDQKFDTLFQTWSPEARRVTGARDKLLRHVHGNTVVGVNIKREMVVSPNDEEVANFSKKHTLFQTKMVEIDTLFQTKTAKKKHTLWRRTYLYSLYKGLPPLPGVKNALQIMSLVAYASETNKLSYPLPDFLRIRHVYMKIIIIIIFLTYFLVSH